MRKISVLIICLTAAMFACDKASVAPASTANQQQAKANIIAGETNLSYLTARTWRYSKYYVSYVSPADPGKLVYQRGAKNNVSELSPDTIRFYTNGTYHDNQKKKSISGTWNFTDPGQTTISVKDPTGSGVLDVLLLNNRHWNWEEHVSDTFAVYAEMTPLPVK